VFPERAENEAIRDSGAAGKPSDMLQMKIDSPQCPERASWLYYGRRFRAKKENPVKEVGEDGR